MQILAVLTVDEEKLSSFHRKERGIPESEYIDIISALETELQWCSESGIEVSLTCHESGSLIYLSED